LFDSIPYGEYYIGVRPNPLSYENALFTYYGDTTNWIIAPVFSHYTDSIGVDINLCYHDPLTGIGVLSGIITENFGYAPSKSTNDYGEPVPGAEIYLEQEPEGEPIASGPTDENGEFHLYNIPDGNYTLFVDIPGLNMSSSYEISGGTVMSNLNFIMGSDSIFAINDITTIQTLQDGENSFQIAPNPSKRNGILKISSDANIQAIQILDASGREILNLNGINKHEYFFDLELQELKKGMYFITISTNNTIQTKKLILN